MHPGRNKYDIGSLTISGLIVVFCAVAFYFYGEVAKSVMRYTLEARFTYILIWIIVVVIFITHFFRLKRKEIVSNTIITKQFGEFADSLLGGISYAISITTALTLLKGLFIQTFFNDKQYFAEFDNLDLATVFVVMLFLLYYSIMKVVEIARETYQVQYTEQVLTESKAQLPQRETNGK